MVWTGLCVLLCMAGAHAKEQAKDATDVDYLALAERLYRDGHYDRAEIALRQVDQTQEGLDVGQFHVVSGLVYLKRDNFLAARKAMAKGVDAGRKDPSIYLALAQANFGLKDWKATIASLDLAGKEATALPAGFVTRAQCHWALKQHDQAIEALDAGLVRFVGHAELMRWKIFYLVELGLFQEVLDLGRAYLARDSVEVGDYLALGQALREARQYHQAAELLEGARLVFPDDDTLLVHLAHTYLADGKNTTAAMLFELAARRDPQYSYEGAELYLRQKRYERALLLNARVPDAKAKVKQRLAIYLKQERWRQISGMGQQLSRLGLLEDDEIRYALAYGYFKSGERKLAERHLRLIQDAAMLERVSALRQTMATCEQAGWQCL